MKQRTWFVTFCGLVLLAGCAKPTGDAIEASDAVIGETFVAFTMSRQQSGTLSTDDHGYVALISRDGESSLIETAVMQNAQLDWNNGKLAFADTENDYILGNSMQVIPTKQKADYQQAFFLTDEETVIGLYNDGFEADGYSEQAVISSSRSTEKTTVEGYYQVTSLCDGDLYGIAEPSGKYVAQAEAQGVPEEDADGYTRLMLNQLTTDGRAAERNTSILAVNSSGQTATNAPCADGSLIHLATVDTAPGEATPVIRHWDVRTGHMAEVPLQDPSGEPVTGPEHSIFEVNGSSPLSLREDHFDWVDSFGRVWSTDVTTGESAKLFDLAGSYDNTTDDRAIDFTEKTLTVVTHHRAENEVRIVRYDRDTGVILSDVQAPDVARIIDDMTIWAVAAKD